MELYQYIHHPETLDYDSLYELRSLLARFPYYQTARLLYLKNLYLLHDPSFGSELRKAALFLGDCRVLFNMVEGDNYVIEPHERSLGEEADDNNTDRTISLIDKFLSTIPKENEHRSTPNVINPATDYVSYLMQMEEPELQKSEEEQTSRTDNLIDKFISSHATERITLPEVAPESFTPEPQEYPLREEDTLSEPLVEQVNGVAEKDEIIEDDSCLTETLAKIYIKQQRYSKALEIIKRISLKNPKKNAYFADQMRFLEKLIINNKNNKE